MNIEEWIERERMELIGEKIIDTAVEFNLICQGDLNRF
jgi:hypothetical protein